MEELCTITGVNEHDDAYSIGKSDGWSFYLNKEYCNGVIPKVGDKIQTHCYNFNTVRGVTLNGVLLYYKTDEELEAERVAWLEQNEKDKQSRFEKQKEQLDADYNNLPTVFKERIDRFRENNPRFRVDYEAYEMFCCKEAVKIADALETVEKITKFKEAKWEDQLIMVPVLSEDHSGNTFGCACGLAKLYIEHPEFVSKVHGALSPLVGSEEYGDIAKEKI